MEKEEQQPLTNSPSGVGGDPKDKTALRALGKRRKTMRFVRAFAYATCTIFCLVGLGKVGSNLGAVVFLIAALGLGIAAMGQFIQAVFDGADTQETGTIKAQDGAVGTVEPPASERQEVTVVEPSHRELLTEIEAAPLAQAEADNVEQAEAALRALGQRLTWSQPMPYADSSFQLGRDKESPGGDMYTVRYEKPPASVLAISPTYVSQTPWAAATIGGEERGPQSVIIGGEKTVPQHKYRTVDAAKAACERHHATGVWE